MTEVAKCLQASESRRSPQALAGSAARRRRRTQRQSATWSPRCAFLKRNRHERGDRASALPRLQQRRWRCVRCPPAIDKLYARHNQRRPLLAAEDRIEAHDTVGDLGGAAVDDAALIRISTMSSLAMRSTLTGDLPRRLRWCDPVIAPSVLVLRGRRQITCGCRALIMRPCVGCARRVGLRGGAAVRQVRRVVGRSGRRACGWGRCRRVRAFVLPAPGRPRGCAGAGRA